MWKWEGALGRRKKRGHRAQPPQNVCSGLQPLRGGAGRAGGGPPTKSSREKGSEMTASSRDHSLPPCQQQGFKGNDVIIFYKNRPRGPLHWPTGWRVWGKMPSLLLTTGFITSFGDTFLQVNRNPIAQGERISVRFAVILNGGVENLHPIPEAGSPDLSELHPFSSPQLVLGLWPYLCGPKAILFLGQRAWAEALGVGTLCPAGHLLLWDGRSEHTVGGQSIFQHTWKARRGWHQRLRMAGIINNLKMAEKTVAQTPPRNYHVKLSLPISMCIFI